ncbi:MAG: endonuclease MutS2 [Clostridia bacterium]|jgi:DNA mismatch repair protein MutS2
MDERTLKILEFDKIVNKLVERSTSVLGKEIAANLKPVNDPGTVRELLKETGDGVSFIVGKGNPPLGGIHDIRESLKRAGVGSTLNPGEIMRAGDTLRAAENLKKYSQEGRNSDEERNIVVALIRNLVPNKKLEEKIKRSIVSEEEIADSASSALLAIRRQIKSEQGSIKDKLESIIKSSKYQKFMQDSIVTMRKDRYVVPVKSEYKNEIPGLVHDSSSSGATIFIEPMAVVDANNKIKQLQIKETVEIEKILIDLTNDIVGILDSLESNISILARLDFIFAKAKLSFQYNAMSPDINDIGKIKINKGRHPLIDEKEVVPIDLWIGEDFKTLVITGPNTGGKTVTLKTVGLFTLMTQSGLHIPANDGTKMSIFDNVFADIGDEQSIEQSLSTFSSHMKNIVKIIKRADDKSLVLFDELGAGTDPTEGAALAMSILECLHQTGATALATTHYSELKVYAFSTKGVENACCEFDVETLKPTYKLLIGVPGRSNAFAISKRLGLEEGIIERAKEFLSGEEIKFEDMLLSIEKSRADVLKEKLKAKTVSAEIEDLKAEIEKQKKKFEVQKEQMLKEARLEAKKIISSAKDETDELIKKLKDAEKEEDSKLRNKMSEEVRVKLKGKIKDAEFSLSESIIPRRNQNKITKELKQGDSVILLNIDKKGTVLVPKDSNDEVIVQVGIMKINVHISNLQFADEQGKVTEKALSGRMGATKSKSISSEIDLRGLLQDEAINLTDKYLDDIVMSGLHEVTIIHGKGTGALRAGIHKYLKLNKHVKSFRLGAYGEGDSGVTIVEMKR